MLVALTAVSLVLAAWITASGATPVFTSPSQPETAQPTSTATPKQQGPPPGGEARESGKGWLPPYLMILMYVLMVLFAVALLTVIVSKATERRRRRRELADLGEPMDVDELSDEELSASLAATAAARLAAMATGSPRNAIVRCWVELEEAVVPAGLERNPALTAAEFTREVLGRLAVDRGAITVLSDLYREARFSEHDLTEEHRTRATAALQALQDQLPSHPVAHAEHT